MTRALLWVKNLSHRTEHGGPAKMARDVVEWVIDGDYGPPDKAIKLSAWCRDGWHFVSAGIASSETDDDFTEVTVVILERSDPA